MKIAFVAASISRKAGGLYESVRRLAQSLLSSASHVQVFTLEDEFTAADRSDWDPVPVTAFPVLGPSRFGYALELTRALIGSDANLVMSHGLWMYPSMATTRWQSRTRGPCIVHPHGMLDSWAVRNSGFTKCVASLAYERRHLERAACIRALCESEARSIRSWGLTNPIVVIPNGIDLPPAEVTGRTLRGPSAAALPSSAAPSISDLVRAGRKILLYLGRLHPKKGLVNLLKAWAILRNSPSSILKSQLDQWTLVIAGWDQSGHETELKQLASELNLPWSDLRSEPQSHSSFPLSHPQLVFLGPQFNDHKAACYRLCDAFILPSFSEGLPMAILEAWAHAKPVLMTPECNLPEGFSAGAALRIEANPQGIARGLCQLVQLSASDLDSIGARGRNLVAERFAWPKVASGMKAVYEWIVGGGPEPDHILFHE